MDLSCFEGDIIAVKLENSDKLLCWRFESDYHSINARFNPISDMFGGKLGRKKLIEQHYATIEEGQDLIGVYGYRDKKQKFITSIGFIISEELDDWIVILT